MGTTKVLIVDDNIQYRWSLMEALIGHRALEIVEEASDGNEAVEKGVALKPDVVLMELYLPSFNGIQATRRLHTEVPDINILMNTVSDNEADLFEALKVGARGYLLKGDKPDMIAEAIQYTAQGGMIVSPSMAAKLLTEFRTQKSVDGGSASGLLDGGRDEPATAEQTDATDQDADFMTYDRREVPSEESFASGPQKSLVSNADLVLSRPVEPSVILRLDKWLREVGYGVVGKVNAHIEGDTSINVSFPNPTPLPEMLVNLPFVNAVKEVPYVPGIDKELEKWTEASMTQFGNAQQTPPRRFHLDMTPSH